MHRALIAIVAVALLAACSKPAMPDKDKPVEPQAARHDDLSRAIDAPLRKARAAQGVVDAAAKAQDAAIDAAAEAAPSP
jgi:outer membrane biogenesis lipoprotein LolB